MHSGTYDLIRAAQCGDAAALETLTRENAPLIRSIAFRFRGRGTEDEDLFQLGAIGFIKAVRGFDTERGLALSTYAVPMIMGEVRRYLRDSGTVKVSRSMRELAQKAAAASQTLSSMAGEEVPLSAVAKYLGCETELLAQALCAVQTPDSLDRPLSDGKGQLADILPEGEDLAEKSADRITLLSLLKSGNETERNVIFYRYYKDKTQSETARILGLTQVQVSRAEKKAITRLRTLLRPPREETS